MPISALYSVPDTHILYIGPSECARHNCRMNFCFGRISFLCPSDMEFAMGRSEDLVIESVEQLIERYKGRLRGIVFFTGCQTQFMNVDFEELKRKIRSRYRLASAHYMESRFQRFDKVRVGESDLYSNLFEMLDRYEGKRSGICVLSGNIPFSADNELFRLADGFGQAWVQSSGNWKKFEDFQRCAEAALNLVTSEKMVPAARYLEKRFGIPWLFLPHSFRLQKVEKNYGELERFFCKRADTEGEGDKSRSLIEEAQSRLEGRKLEVDLTHAAHPWDMARALLEYGFDIDSVTVNRFKNMRANGAARETLDDYRWIRENFPELKVEESRKGMHPFEGDRFSQGEVIYGAVPCEAMVRPEAEAFLPVEAMTPNSEGELSRWGYAALNHLMETLLDQCSR